jgi:hypothetical protein
MLFGKMFDSRSEAVNMQHGLGAAHYAAPRSKKVLNKKYTHNPLMSL